MFVPNLRRLRTIPEGNDEYGGDSGSVTMRITAR
jgi:hypothetical protein